MDQDLLKLTDKELVLLWERGCSWLNSYLDTGDNEETSLKALKRIECIEDELQKRGVTYG